MTEFGIGKGKQEKTKDIFGSTIRDSVVKSLVESNSHDEFQNNAEELMQKWCALGNSEAQFSEYFRLHKLQHTRSSMAAELLAMVRLGFPPKPYTQNAKYICYTYIITKKNFLVVKTYYSIASFLLGIFSQGFNFFIIRF